MSLEDEPFQLLNTSVNRSTLNSDDKAQILKIKQDLKNECSQYGLVYCEAYSQTDDICTDNMIPVHNASNLVFDYDEMNVVSSDITLMEAAEQSPSQLINDHHQENTIVDLLAVERKMEWPESKVIVKEEAPAYEVPSSPRSPFVFNNDQHVTHRAVQEKDMRKFERELSSSAGFSQLLFADYKGNSAVHLIAYMEPCQEKYEFLEILKNQCILDKNQKLLKEVCHRQNGKGDCPLHILTRLRDTQGIEKLLRVFRSPRDIVNVENAKKKTCLYLSCENKDWELVEFYVEMGGDVNIGARSGKKPIHFACENNLLGILKLLLENGAIPNQMLNGKNEKKLATCPEVRAECDKAMKKGRNERARLKRKEVKKKQQEEHEEKRRKSS